MVDILTYYSYGLEANIHITGGHHPVIWGWVKATILGEETIDNYEHWLGNPLVTQPESRVKNHPGLKDIFADRLFVHFFRAFRTNFTFFDVIFPFPAKPHAFLLNY